MRKSLGIDIGGTSVSAIIMDEKENILAREEVKSITTDKEAMFSQVIKAADSVLLEAKIHSRDLAGIGVGVPGKVDRKKGIALFQNNLPWENFPLRERLAEHYANENIQLDNDVHAAALAEWNQIAGQKKQSFVYITISTGISCATIHEGKFLRGAGFAGEIGFLPVPTDLNPEGQARLEEVASGPAIAKLAQEHLKNKNLSTKEVFALAKAGQQEAEKIIKSSAKAIASALYSIICLIDPEQIILGGGVINKNQDLLPTIKKQLAKQSSQAQNTSLDRISLSHYKENSGVIGAALLTQRKP